ncbi:MAG TPA: hypothetical protein VGG75_31045 [Trebonia sp.]
MQVDPGTRNREHESGRGVRQARRDRPSVPARGPLRAGDALSHREGLGPAGAARRITAAAAGQVPLSRHAATPRHPPGTRHVAAPGHVAAGHAAAGREITAGRKIAAGHAAARRTATAGRVRVPGTGTPVLVPRGALMAAGMLLVAVLR